MPEQAINKRYFELARISLEIRSELPITDHTFDDKFLHFETEKPLQENIVLHHRFNGSSDISRLYHLNAENRIHFKVPWAIYYTENRLIYQWIDHDPPHVNYYRSAITDKEHTHMDIYNDAAMEKKFMEGGLTTLTMFPTDQILMGRLLAYRQGCIIHSLGIDLDGQGVLFVGHSDAGKSTMAGIMRQGADILCDDRNIIRKDKNKYTLSGTWSHGDIPDVSGRTIPLKAIFFLNQAPSNVIKPIRDDMHSFKSLLACLIRPLGTKDWWDKSLTLLSQISRDVPCYSLCFNKSDHIYSLVKEII